MPSEPLFVVPVDFSPDTEALVSAAFAVARTCGAHVHLLEVGKTIHAYVQLTKATLLVIGKHYGTPRWRRSPRIVGGLTRSSSVPVLVLPPQPKSAEVTSAQFSHIVSAVDFTVASAVAVRTVFDVIRRTGARLTLVHALNAPPHMVFSGGEAVRAAKNLLGQTSYAAERLRKKIPSDVRMRVDARVTTGDPYRRILDVASEVKGDLIVMGVAPRSRLEEVLLGSTVRNVLRLAKIPVLMIPVLAGAYKWLEEKDSVEVARRLPSHESRR